jgi:hypothetical protein
MFKYFKLNGAGSIFLDVSEGKKTYSAIDIAHHKKMALCAYAHWHGGDSCLIFIQVIPAQKNFNRILHVIEV